MQSSLVLKDARIFDGEKFQENKAIIIKNSKIADIFDNDSIVSQDGKVISLKNMIVCAGFVDLQINGCGGVLYNDNISEETLEVMLNTNLRFGCTSFLPTLITTTEQDIKKSVMVAKKFHKKYPHNVIGIHIEGPYISPFKRGAHELKYIKPISFEMGAFLISNAKDIPIKITLAPEENSLSIIKRLTDAGIHVSLGHSNATYKQAIEGINSGISLSTHLFNAMSQLNSREPGVVGAVLGNDSVYAGIIIDGKHVDYSNINLAHRLKGDKLYIVTDAVTAMGTNMSEFIFANQKVFIKDDSCVNEEGNLAGSNIDMMSSVKNAVLHANISLEEALKMATLYPANAIKQGNKLGSIKIGREANLVAFRAEDYVVKYCINGGKLHYY